MASTTVNQIYDGGSPVLQQINAQFAASSSVTDAITAHAGGGQGSAVALTSTFNRVTVVATAADSVKLPTAAAGLSLHVINSSANSLNVFPVTGDAINALSANAAFAVAAGKSVQFVSTVAGFWYGNLSA